MRKKSLLLVALFFGLFLWGCYPDGPNYTEDMDLVITHHNPEYNFTAKGTYAMPDRIVKITGNKQEGEAPEYIPDATAKSILDKVAENMESLGWDRIVLTTDGPKPDLLLAPASWETTTIYYYYDYWGWWYGGYYPPYGGYYPPVYYGGSYTTGTLLLTLMDPNELSGTGYPVNQWTGAINGILNSKYNPQRVLPLVDQMFDQSPYLKTN